MYTVALDYPIVVREITNTALGDTIYLISVGQSEQVRQLFCGVDIHLQLTTIHKLEEQVEHFRVGIMDRDLPVNQNMLKMSITILCTIYSKKFVLFSEYHIVAQSLPFIYGDFLFLPLIQIYKINKSFQFFYSNLR